MSLSLIESPRGRSDSLQGLREELIVSLQSGEWRVVIVVRDEQSNVLHLGFPKDDRALRGELDMAACEFIPYLEKGVLGCDSKQTLFGHLGVSEGTLFVHTASDSMAKPTDPQIITQLVREYLA